MAYIPPTLSEIRAQVSSRVEAKTGQKVPAYEKAFAQIVVSALSLFFYPFYKFASWKYDQSFTISADEDSLELYHGPEEGVTREGKTKIEFTVTLTVSDPSVVTLSTTFENESTGLYYFPKFETAVTVTSNEVVLVGDGYGTEYLVDVADVLKITGSGITGISSECVVSEISVYPSDGQETEDFRKDILDKKASGQGGGTPYEYRSRAQAVDGVYRAFPFSGRPYDPDSSLPGDRSVYIESDSALGTDGVSSTTLLSNVKSALRVDPDTGLSLEALGLTDSDLFVESIIHVQFNVEIDTLVVDEAIESQVKSAVESAVDEYFRSMSPYCFGVDAEYDRDDNVSAVTVSGIVNDVLKQYSATAANITIEEVGVGVVPNRPLIGGDLARLNTVSYVS